MDPWLKKEKTHQSFSSHDPPMLRVCQASVTLVDVQVVKVLLKVCEVAVTEVTVREVLVPVMVRLVRVVVTIT